MAVNPASVTHLHFAASWLPRAAGWMHRAWLACASPGRPELALLNEHMLRDTGMEDEVHRDQVAHALEMQLLRKP